MIELSFVPTACKGETATMKGELKVLAPPYPKRLQYQAKFAGLANDPNEAGKSEGVKRQEQMLMISELVSESQQYIKSVDLEMLDGSVKAKTVDELFCINEFEGVLIEVAMAMVQGFSGNSQRP